MGLFKFIKDAGAKLFGTSAKAEEIAGAVKGTGLDTSGVSFSLNGDRVVLSGTAMSQEEAERLILAAGNTVGVAEVDTSGLIVTKETPAAEFYTVKKGDTLWAIAEKHYGKGHGAKYTEIVKANSPPVKNPDLIQPGWVLRLPPAS
ncbi:peptidoglycan-binding protein LysM [Alsobacter sp. R-9]